MRAGHEQWEELFLAGVEERIVTLKKSQSLCVRVNVHPVTQKRPSSCLSVNKWKYGYRKADGGFTLSSPTHTTLKVTDENITCRARPGKSAYLGLQACEVFKEAKLISCDGTQGSNGLWASQGMWNRREQGTRLLLRGRKYSTSGLQAWLHAVCICQTSSKHKPFHMHHIILIKSNWRWILYLNDW